MSEPKEWATVKEAAFLMDAMSPRSIVDRRRQIRHSRSCRRGGSGPIEGGAENRTRGQARTSAWESRTTLNG